MSKKISRIVLLGPQGSGKSTQAKVIAKFLKLKIIAAGKLLRAEIKTNSDLGKKLAPYVDKGKLVPDELILNLIFTKIEQAKQKFLLDGFPRNLHQAKIFNDNYQIDKLFNIKISDKEAISRISGRRVCINGHLWNIKFQPTKKKGVCDICSQALKQRKDDQPKTVKKRLAIYRKQTSKLLGYYQGKVVVFDGEQSIDKVSKDILKYLKKDVR